MLRSLSDFVYVLCSGFNTVASTNNHPRLHLSLPHTPQNSESEQSLYEFSCIKMHFVVSCLPLILLIHKVRKYYLFAPWERLIKELNESNTAALHVMIGVGRQNSWSRKYLLTLTMEPENGIIERYPPLPLTVLGCAIMLSRKRRGTPMFRKKRSKVHHHHEPQYPSHAIFFIVPSRSNVSFSRTLLVTTHIPTIAIITVLP